VKVLFGSRNISPGKAAPNLSLFGAARGRYGVVRKNEDDKVWFPPASIESTSHS
jgi:hypothetical protein